MCHVHHYQIIQQARVTAGYPIKELEEVLARGGPLVMENTLGNHNISGEGQGDAPAQLVEDKVYTAFLSVRGFPRGGVRSLTLSSDLLGW